LVFVSRCESYSSTKLIFHNNNKKASGTAAT